MDPISQQAAQSQNAISRAFLKLYAVIYRADQKFGRPRTKEPGDSDQGKSTVVVPKKKTQWVLALILLICQTGITFTGSLVRVTGSGLGCETWPQCHPGSMFPVDGAAPWIHQIIEFGNRLLTFVLAAAALVVFIAVLRAARRTSILHLAFIQGLGIIAQAVIGGITVRLELSWWIVALHFIPSMLLVFLGAVLLVKIKETDSQPSRPQMPRALSLLNTASAVALLVTLVTGTLVTSAGPHAGDIAILPEHRLQVSLEEIAHIHAHAMYLYLGMVVGLVAALSAVSARPRIRRAALWLTLGIIVQGGVGILQYWMGVPRWTVPFHVIGSGLVTLATGYLWALRSQRSRTGLQVKTKQTVTESLDAAL